MNIKHRLLPALGLAAMVASPTLHAADFNFGAQAGMVSAQGDLKARLNAKNGFTLGGHALIAFEHGHAIRPRIDFTQLKGTKQVSASLNVNASTPMQVGATQRGKATSLTLGTDYLYFVERTPDQGLYLVAGAGLSFNKATVDLGLEAGPVAGGATVSVQSVLPSLNLGVGYQFNKTIGVEAGYRISSIAAQDADLAGSFPYNGETATFSTGKRFDEMILKNWTLSATVRF